MSIVKNLKCMLWKLSNKCCAKSQMSVVETPKWVLWKLSNEWWGNSQTSVVETPKWVLWKLSNECCGNSQTSIMKMTTDFLDSPALYWSFKVWCLFNRGTMFT